MTHHQPNDDEARIKVRELIETIRTVMLVTADEDGDLHSRPMRVVTVEDDIVWFFTEANSPKVFEIEQDRDVLLACANPSSSEYVSVRGKGRLVRDAAKQKELWSEAARPWFPDGAESPNLALIAVKMIGAEYWDSSSSTAIFAYGYVKALVTKAPAEGGDNAKVRFGAK